MDFKELLDEFNLSQEFTLDVIDELDAINDTLSEQDMEGRVDLRKLNTFTIDGEDAKDFDDAVSIEVLENGNYYLGVHIADVSHYVRENTALDRAAQSRGTSVYLVDKVVPMLPFKLSNGICSLNPNENRLTMTVFIEVNENGNVLDYSICNSVIRSKHRLTYNEVTEILEGRDSGHSKQLVSDLFLMKELALKLRDKRIRRGSLEFDIPEVKVITDITGKTIGIEKYQLALSNHIIEEFMLAANETIARHMFNNENPMVYRVHEKPSTDKIAVLSRFLQGLGYDLKVKENISPNRLQVIINQIAGTEVEQIVSMMMLRSMMKARYCEENLGHFGLAATYYCHFTSPIRRYPDLAVHRILKKSLNGGLTDWEKTHFNKYVRHVADDSSAAEVNAAEAERTWRDVKICEYMKDFIGETFEGIISSVTSFGFYVELPSAVDGLVPMRDLADDYYIFDEELLRLVGKHSGRIYKLGDYIKVKLVRVDEETRQIDFIPVENETRVDKRVQKVINKRKTSSSKKNHLKHGRRIKQRSQRGRIR